MIRLTSAGSTRIADDDDENFYTDSTPQAAPIDMFFNAVLKRRSRDPSPVCPGRIAGGELVDDDDDDETSGNNSNKGEEVGREAVHCATTGLLMIPTSDNEKGGGEDDGEGDGEGDGEDDGEDD